MIQIDPSNYRFVRSIALLLIKNSNLVL